MKKRSHTFLLTMMLLPLAAMFAPCPAAAVVKVQFQYKLSNFSGPLPYHWAELAVDRRNNEVYALDNHENEVRIFDAHGMEIYSFGEHKKLIGLRGLAVHEEGDIFVLARKGIETVVRRCNYRGEPGGDIEIRGLPAEHAAFQPDRLHYQDGRLYLANTGTMVTIVADPDGLFREAIDLKGLLLEQLAKGHRFDAGKMKDIEMVGFGIDRRGNILFTVPTLFTAFRVTPDRTLTGFGTSGSAPGRFGVVAGIAADDQGRIYVADRLRCVVLVFDPAFNFLTEFGYRGGGEANLTVPNDVAIGADGRIYVAQAAYQGVSVFKVFPE
jgi:DNA-binding beta-propeller fold protein YncE